jgi:predicted Zn-dependent protease
MNDLKSKLSAIDTPVDWVGLREVSETTTSRLIRDGNPLFNDSSVSTGIMVEVLTQGQFAYYGTKDSTSKGIAEAAKKAAKLAELSAPYSVYKFDENSRPVHRGSFHSPHQKTRQHISAGELNELLLKSNHALKISDKIVSATSMCVVVESDHHFVSSSGSDITQDFVLLEFDLRATAQDGNDMQTRTFGGMRGNCFQIGMEYFDELELLAHANRIGEQALELLTAENCPDEQTELVIASDQMMLQIHESVGHAIEVDRILGDERNYAGWSFVNLSDFGSLKYGSSLMNITFDPTVSHQFASYGFDDGGLKAEKHYLIKDGILLRGLGGQESQIRSGVPGVANFRASSWNRAPIDRMANINLEAGDASFEKIIGSVERGVYMESNRSWSIDDYRNKFQFGCEYAKLIENGKLTKTLKNPNYRGISSSFWKNLKMVGDKNTFKMYGTPNCGKGEPNQVIRVGHASPVCLFSSVDVFGGA